jgi:Zn ribbon nucleic-acid-binding protein
VCKKMKVISRNEARLLGLKRYFTGKMCPNNHLSERFVSGGNCVACNKINAKQWKKNNKEKVAEHCKTYYQKNATGLNEKAKNYHKDNKAKIIAQKKKYRLENCDAEKQRGKNWRALNADKKRDADIAWRSQNLQKVRAYREKWRKENPEAEIQSKRNWLQQNRAYSRASAARYRAQKKDAAPPWADMKKIQQIYNECLNISMETSILHHVDHIVPLRNPKVCGLHVPWNLQIITARDNQKKGNKMPPIKMQRAAIMEFDGGLSRERAEKLAYARMK